MKGWVSLKKNNFHRVSRKQSLAVCNYFKFSQISMFYQLRKKLQSVAQGRMCNLSSCLCCMSKKVIIWICNSILESCCFFKDEKTFKSNLQSVPLIKPSPHQVCYKVQQRFLSCSVLRMSVAI